jgi:peptidylprolyl isomerase
VPTNKQRRDTARRHLERQLQRRVEREARRRRVTLISTIAGTIALIAVIIISVVWLSSGDATKPAAKKKPSTSPSSSVTSPSPTPSTSYPPAKGAAVTFNGVTVKGATDLNGYPVVTSKGSGDPNNLEVKDLVTGKGASAKPTSTVTVQYYGALYKDGKYFDSSWKRGQPATFTLGPGKVIDGFTEGIGGAKGIAGMKVGGRRIIIMPSALGYGKTGSPPTIPANSPLVFIVDLKAVS